MTANYEALAKRLDRITGSNGTVIHNIRLASQAIRDLTALVREAREALDDLTSGDIDISGTAYIYGDDAREIMAGARATLTKLGGI